MECDHFLILGIGYMVRDHATYIISSKREYANAHFLQISFTKGWIAERSIKTNQPL